MSAFDPLAAAAGLLASRRAGRRLGGRTTPETLDEAYAIHDAQARALGQPVPAWKVSNLTREQRIRSGFPTPISAPLFAPWTKSSPARFDLAAFVEAPALECEFAFQLAVDIPPRPTPYVREEIVARVAAVRPAIEIVDKRIAEATPVEALADCMASGGFVYGSPIVEWRRLDLSNAAVALAIDNSRVAWGIGAAVLGDPLMALVELANAPPPWTRLAAGQIVTTGSCTGVTTVTGPCTAKADFGQLGTVEIRFD
ncbi:MAG: 2-keto-4-pentenoate hydratase [Tagaea sp.]